MKTLKTLRNISFWLFVLLTLRVLNNSFGENLVLDTNPWVDLTLVFGVFLIYVVLFISCESNEK